MNSYNLRNSLVKLIIPLSVFQDFITQYFFPTIALASPVFIIITIILFLDIKLIGNKLLKINLLMLIIIIFLISINFLNYFKFINIDYPENLFVKGLKIAVLYFYWIYCVYLISKIEIKYLNKIFAISFLILLMGFFIDYLYHDSYSYKMVFHFGKTMYLTSADARNSGFSFESSTFGVTAIILGLINIDFYRSVVSRSIIIIGLLIVLIGTESKAALPALLISILLATAYNKKILFGVSTFLILVMFFYFPEGYQFLYSIFFLPFELEIQSSTSFATRFTTAIIAYLIAIDNPFGVGFTGYIPSFLDYINSAGILAENLTGLHLNFEEIDGYLLQNNWSSVGAKSFIFENLIIWGFPFLFYWIYSNIIFFAVVSEKKNMTCLIILIFNFIALSSYVGIYNMYIIAIAYGYLINKFDISISPFLVPVTKRLNL